MKPLVRKTRRDYTKGSILGAIFHLSWPIVLAEILQLTYMLTDTFWVGRLGKEAVASISLNFPIIFFLTSFGGGFAIAGTILVSQYYGNKNQKQVDYVSSQTVINMFIVSLILTIIGYFSAESIINMLGAEASVASLSISYMKIIFLGMPLLFQYFIFQSLLRGVGDVKTPMYIVLGTVLLNLILDPLFIFGYSFIPAMGVDGAAWATLGTQGLAGLIGIILLFTGKFELKVKKEYLKPDIKLAKKIFNLGLPTALENSIRSFGLIVMTGIVAGFGTVMIASWGIGSRMLNFVIVPCFGLSIATSTLVGQNIGAKKINRAEKTGKYSAIIGFLTLTLFGIIMFFAAENIAKLFVPGELEVIKESTLFIRLMAFTFGFIALRMIIGGVFRGSGNTKTSFIVALTYLWILNIPLAYILSYYTTIGARGIWYALPIANVISALIALIIFLTGKWKEKKLIED